MLVEAIEAINSPAKDQVLENVLSPGGLLMETIENPYDENFSPEVGAYMPDNTLMNVVAKFLIP